MASRLKSTKREGKSLSVVAHCLGCKCIVPSLSMTRTDYLEWLRNSHDAVLAIVVVAELVLSWFPEELLATKTEGTVFDGSICTLGAGSPFDSQRSISVPLVRVDAEPSALAPDTSDELALVGSVSVESDPVLTRAVGSSRPFDVDILAELVLRHWLAGLRKVGQRTVSDVAVQLRRAQRDRVR